MNNQRISVLLPCFNEAITLAKVITDFQQFLPEAEIYVFDNNSTDDSVKIAQNHNSIVKKVGAQGKGNVVRSMFATVDSDVYLMVDADDTYPAEVARELIATLNETSADMVTGDRISQGKYFQENKRPFHNFGNNLVRWLINKLFRAKLKDIMTGFRVFNKKFVKNMPVMSVGFDIETEMTLHALDKRFSIVEMPVDYQDRPEGSHSKLNTLVDGVKVLKTIMWLFKDYKPLTFFAFLSAVFFALSVGVAIPVIIDYLNTSLVLRIPTTILASGLMIVSVLALFVGFILDTVVKQHRMNFELRMNDNKK